MSKPILCLDFDGVCHMYTSGWKGADNIPDTYVPGLFEFLEAAKEHFDIQVFSSRSNQEGGTAAMTAWFYEMRKRWRAEGGKPPIDTPLTLSFPTVKPPAFIGIDDRVITFRGEWPDIEELRGFKTWTQDPRGATHRFPRGKFNDSDQGELRLAIYQKQGTIILDFGKPVAWMGLDKKTAQQMVSLLTQHANSLSD